MGKLKLYGKEYPSRVTMGAMIDFKNRFGKDVNDIGTDVELLTGLMYCAVRSACRADGVDFDIEFERFADGVDLVDFTSFQEGMGAGPDDSKKKTE